MAEAGSQFIVKFVYGEDMRRVRLRDVSYELLQQAAQEAFLDAPTAAAAFDLKYEDDEGDQCTLTPATFTDFMDMSKSQAPKLWLVASCAQATPRARATPGSTPRPSSTPDDSLDSRPDVDGASSFPRAEGATSFPGAQAQWGRTLLPEKLQEMLRLLGPQLAGSNFGLLSPLLTSLAPQLRDGLADHEAEVDQALSRCVNELLPVLVDVDEVLKPLQPFHEVRIMLGEVLQNAAEGATLNGMGVVLHEFLTVFCRLPPAQQHDAASSLAQALGTKLEQLLLSHLPSSPTSSCPPPRSSCPSPTASCPPPTASCPPPGWQPHFHKGWGKGWGKGHCGKGWGKKGKEPFLKGLVKGLAKGHGKGWWGPPMEEEEWLTHNDSETSTDSSSTSSHSSSSCDWHLDSAKKECMAAKVTCKRACREAKERYKSEVKAAKQCLKQAKKEWKKERHEWKKEKKSHKHGHKHGRHHHRNKGAEHCGHGYGADGGQMDVEADMAERSTVPSAAAPDERLPDPPATAEEVPEVGVAPSSEREELRILREMGFDNVELNTQLLETNNWDVSEAISILLSR